MRLCCVSFVDSTVSQMVIEEVSALQTQLEIEKSCRENAEALATKLNCENKKLKYLSLTSRPCLDELLPSISDCIALEEEAEPQDTSPDPYAQYQQQVKDLQETVNALLDEKKQLVCQLKEQQRQVEELNGRSEKDHSEIKELYRTIEQQNQTIKKFNRVSVMAAQEYEGLKEQLELEQNLRQKAECFAHEMMVKQKEANRQSTVLLQQSEPSLQLLKALEDLAHVTKTLEQERLQHQREVKALETALQESALHRQLEELQKQMELLEEEKREVEGRLQDVEKHNGTLETRGVCVRVCVCLPPFPVPHLAICVCVSVCVFLVNSSLIAIMRKSSKSTKGAAKLEQTPVNAGVDDVKVKAVNEMMERIKHGVVLRPVKGQDTKVSPPLPPPASDDKQQESAMEELKGILETVKRSPSRGFPEPVPGKKDSELEVILRRRRKQACDPEPISKVSSSESLHARRSADSTGTESAVLRRSSDCGKGARGSRPGSSARNSLSDRDAPEVLVNGCCDR
uniref:Si:dkey-280e21.3 n=1 Tax=Scleropages formosus TaxID=113540 RepID=A0A8C9U5S4_SCLFO